ncbi:MAG: hypothetical protein QNL04_11480 [SAR324 cluster bacterium]|nr:hypothetical protein [SAR324 cluster bacterium]
MSTSSVNVYSASGTPQKGIKVVLGFSLGMSKPAWTDSNGNAEVEHSTTGKATIYVNGNSVGEFLTPGHFTATI